MIPVPLSPHALKTLLTQAALDLGFDAVRVTRPNLQEASVRLQAWLAAGHHGEMNFMRQHAALRADPEALHPGTLRVISVCMSYLTTPLSEAETTLTDPRRGYIS